MDDEVLKIVGLWGQNALVQVMIAPLAVTLDRLLSFTMPQFPLMDNNHPYLNELLGLNIIYLRVWSKQYLVT